MLVGKGGRVGVRGGAVMMEAEDGETQAGWIAGFETKGGAASHGYQAACSSWKRQDDTFSLRLSGNAALLRLYFRTSGNGR